LKTPRRPPPSGPRVGGSPPRRTLSRTNDYQQAGERYRTMPAWEREDLLLNLITHLSQCERSIQERMVGHLRKCDEDYGHRVAEGLQLPVGESVAQNAVVS